VPSETVFTLEATPVKFGPGAVADAGWELKRLGVTRALLVTDPGVAAVGIPARVRESVEAEGIEVVMFDRARVEYQRHLDLLHSLEPGLEFVMRHVSCEYEAPARFDDEIEVFIRTASIGRTSWRWEMAVHQCESGALLAHAEQVMVLIDRNERRPEPVPAHMRDAVAAFEGGA